ncbi:transposase [Mycolicibacterium sp. (ex Dasyatis americana)]|uniref:Transposase n=1 Tax=Mycobacterium syngnathidarum TaxID=1908205 RepID=A0A1S1JDF6_9MYCO|nr:transposase [Mycolicibacterium sp. (ex Dasyatis americana)]OFB40188.1 transposase [Mycolicibacterium sp. (ex Dasyatis americana)]OHT77435.1 transposase [Mycobacterium syngnathidarum]OLT96044.1 transposase [Mycobacterium syngnathidarum]
MCRAGPGREGRFAPGHLGELTQIVSADLVDAALQTTGGVQRRVRVLPSRVVVYLLLAGALFAEIGYQQVWARLVAGLDPAAVAAPGSSALSQAFRRVGVAPLRELFTLLRGPAVGAARWHGLLVCAIDGTTMFAPNSDANAAAFGRQTGRPDAESGYPMLRLLTVVACGTRTVIDAVFGSYRVGEITYAPTLLRCLKPDMLLLADRNFAVTALAEQIVAAHADLLIRCKDTRVLPPIKRLPDRTWLARMGAVTVRVIDAHINVRLDGGTTRCGHYRLVTTLLDETQYSANELVNLYHQRWEIETSYLELKSTILGGRVLRAGTPAGITQEVYALLITYQALRTAIADTSLAHPTISPDRLSLTVALHAARDQVIHAAATITATTVDLIGRIGAAVLNQPLPARRSRSSPRVVKRAISKHRAKGAIDRTNYTTTITIEILDG